MPPSKKSSSSHRSSSRSSSSSRSRSSSGPSRRSSSRSRGYRSYEDNENYLGSEVQLRHSFYGILRKIRTFIIVVPLLVIAAFAFLSGGSMNFDTAKEKFASISQNISGALDVKSGESDNQEIFVSEIGRTCPWDSEYESYYDKTTDCYFWQNDTINPPEWQYWYEGISSDFGDYGWMEYDYDENIWYIEVSDGEWNPLPEKYDTTKLWHFSTSR